VRWASLTHAFGTAADVPDLLVRLCRGGTDGGSALEELFETIWHQGTVYSATVEAVPFLGALASDRQLQATLREQLVVLLFLIAGGVGYYQVHGSLDPPDERNDDVDRQLTDEQAVVSGCRVACARAARRLFERVDDLNLTPAGWCALAGLAVRGGLSVSAVDRVLNRITTDDELLRLGGRVLRSLTDNAFVEAERWRAVAAADEDLGDYLTEDEPALGEVGAQDFLVELLVERMMVRAADIAQ
jgi:hypothetical protein